jgi:hypothetical protein
MLQSGKHKHNDQKNLDRLPPKARMLHDYALNEDELRGTADTITCEEIIDAVLYSELFTTAENENTYALVISLFAEQNKQHLIAFFNKEANFIYAVITETQPNMAQLDISGKAHYTTSYELDEVLEDDLGVTRKVTGDIIEIGSFIIKYATTKSDEVFRLLQIEMKEFMRK